MSSCINLSLGFISVFLVILAIIKKTDICLGLSVEERLTEHSKARFTATLPSYHIGGVEKTKADAPYFHGDVKILWFCGVFVEPAGEEIDILKDCIYKRTMINSV